MECFQEEGKEPVETDWSGDELRWAVVLGRSVMESCFHKRDSLASGLV